MNKEETTYILRWAKKIRAVNLLGGKCQHCGCSDIFCIEFHHNRDEKYKNISKLRDSRWSVISKELQDCIVLCNNCHAEFHCTGESSRYYPRKLKILNELKITGCEECGYIGKNYASLEFHHINSEDKGFGLSDILSRNVKIPVNILDDELAKCKILCGNCHSREHIDTSKFEKYKSEIYKRVNTYKEIQPKIDRLEVQKMLNSGMKQIEIARHFNASKGTISGIVKKLKIPIDI